jgi:hypothetical protein
MKKLSLTLVLALLWTGTAYAKGGTVSVRGYVTKNGTYVAPHYRTAPNDTKLDNWSTKGNVNPYTGKEGTKDPGIGSGGLGYNGGTSPGPVFVPTPSTTSNALIQQQGASPIKIYEQPVTCVGSSTTLENTTWLNCKEPGGKQYFVYEIDYPAARCVFHGKEFGVYGKEGIAVPPGTEYNNAFFMLATTDSTLGSLVLWQDQGGIRGRFVNYQNAPQQQTSAPIAQQQQTTVAVLGSPTKDNWRKIDRGLTREQVGGILSEPTQEKQEQHTHVVYPGERVGNFVLGMTKEQVGKIGKPHFRYNLADDVQTWVYVNKANGNMLGATFASDSLIAVCFTSNKFDTEDGITTDNFDKQNTKLAVFYPSSQSLVGTLDKQPRVSVLVSRYSYVGGGLFYTIDKDGQRKGCISK